LTKTDRCVGVLSWRINQLFVLYFLGLILLTACLRRRRMSMRIYLSTLLQFHSRRNFSKFYQRIPGTFRSYIVHGGMLQTDLMVNTYIWRRLRLLSIDKPALSSERAPQHTAVLNFSSTEFNNCPTRCDLFSLLNFCRQLYMFRVLTPIIRSSYNCNYSFWYWLTGSTTMRSRCWVGTDSCVWINSNSTTRADGSRPGWPVPEAVITVVRAPDDGCQHPKYVELPREM